jgi:predicted DNA-binding transcriptional regulator AlpA
MRRFAVAHDEERYLRVRDVVAKTGFAERTVRQLIASGRLTTVRPAGFKRVVRVPESAIVALMGPVQNGSASEQRRLPLEAR